MKTMCRTPISGSAGVRPLIKGSIPRIALVLALCAGWLTLPAEAQYFGRNKVQYKTFQFQVLETPHFDIYFYPEESAGVAHAARMAERWHARLSQVLRHELSGRQPLILYASQSDFQQTNAVPGELGESTGGVTEPLRRRIVLPLAGSLADTDHVIGHELVHAFQFDIMSRSPEEGGAPSGGMMALPLWFIEGMAEYLSIGPVDPQTAMWLRDAAVGEKLPRVKDLDNPDYFPYRWGQAVWAYIGGRWGDDVVGPMMQLAFRSGDLEGTMKQVLGVSEEELSLAWQEAIHAAYDPVLRATRPAEQFGRLLAGSRGLGGSLNVSPSVSPDGKLMAFLSERGLFSIDLFLADTATGRIIRTLTKTAVDPHFSSLQFVNSSGAWDASGRRLAVGAVSSGRPVIALFDVDTGKVEREVRLVDETVQLDEIVNPTWSPDGRQIAFTGLTQGLTDLFVVDLDGGNVRRLTNDPYAELHPAWSPDGRWIAFTTDRFSTRLPSLETGDYRLAVINPASGEVTAVGGLPGGKHINPNWSADSRSLLFLSDAQGVTNLYLVDFAGGGVVPLTNLQTGITGITATSPALSVARNTNLISFSVYEGGEHHIYVADGPSAPVAPAGIGRSRVVTLPPLARRPSEVAALMADPTLGLPPAAGESVREYKPRLELTDIGQPTVAVGVNQFGTYAGGGMALFFSDMLGDHNLIAGAELSSSLSGDSDFRDLGGVVGYQNLKHRWNWATTFAQQPYRSGTVQAFTTQQGGQLVGVQDTVIYRQTVRAVGGVVAYPFNRSQRVEFGGALENIAFDQQVLRQTFSLNTGQLLDEQKQTTSLGKALNLGQASAALVYDTSFYGATSPVLGQRYRLEVAPTAGSINFTSATIDYRRYFMPARFYTIAGRLVHFGRYGAGGEDSRLTPLFLGYPDIVRGYDIGSFSADECTPTESGACPEFDRLIGSRMLVGNLEFRFPLLRPFGASSRMYGPIPIEVAFFADSGVAWNRGEKPSMFGGERRPVSSAGAAFRVNAFGYAVAQIAFARPFDRQRQGWVVQFSLIPGF